jgi:hypothetical protein
VTRSLLMGTSIGAMLALGLTGAGTYGYSLKRQADVRKSWNPVTVLHAARDLRRGDLLRPGDLTPGEVVSFAATPTALVPSKLAAFEGRTLAVSLKLGEMVFEGDFAPEHPTPQETCLAIEAEQ